MNKMYENLNKGRMMDNIKEERMGVVDAQLDILGDLPEKTQYNNNSWFAVGRYEVDGHMINMLFHLMGMKVPVKGWTYQSVVTVFDETTGYYYAKDHLYSKSKTEVHQDDFFVKVPNGSMSGDWDKMIIHIDDDEIRMDIETKVDL